MIKKIESIPEASYLMDSLRSVGYKEETAISDIIDNCISAEATKIVVDFDWEKKRILIIDNGKGMTNNELIDNMRIGSADPNKIHGENDLGRFGMGMKTASFSLGKKLTVVTKTDNVISNASWNLDEIAEIGWNLCVYSYEQIAEFANKIGPQGTVIVIEMLDRLIDDNSSGKAKKKFYNVIEKVDKHLGLVFHRFIKDNKLEISINNNKIQAWDPFCITNSATQELSEEQIWNEDFTKSVTIQPYVLPHKTKFLNDKEYQEAGGPKGWNAQQGIYLYRNHRLIIYGTWFDIIKKELAYNLARIKIDITADSDAEWKIDIKKSTASLPLHVRDAVERAVEVATEKSAEVYNSRGTYHKGPISPSLGYVWEQYKKNGQYLFRINKKHTLLNKIRNKLDESGKESLKVYLNLVENLAPCMISGVADTLSKNSQQIVDHESKEYEESIEEIKAFIDKLKKEGFAKEEIVEVFQEMPKYKFYKNEILKSLEDNQ